MFRVLPLIRINHSLAPDWTLDAKTIAQRREEFGANDVIEHARNPWWEIIRETLLDPMIWFLFAASILFALLSKYTSSIIMLSAIIPIGGMDAFLHWRTQVSTQALSSRLITFATVIREGKEFVIAAREIVPGDLLLVKAGEYFAADGILVAADNAQADESSLTGEAYPVTKQIIASLSDKNQQPLIAYEHWGFVGTRLLTGRVLMRVVFTGKETIYGEIVTSVLTTQQDKTPLQIALAKFVLTLLIISLIFCIILACVRYWQGFGIIDALLSATTLAVVALPDEFPMTFTFFLGVGVYRLAKKHALVRRAVSVENIGRTSCICTDKTGTITTGRFHIASVVPAPEMSDADLGLCASLAARSDSGDPLDEAILDAFDDLPKTDYQFLHVFPFTEERKRETAVYEIEKSRLFVSKGAPEVIFKLAKLNAEQRKYWHTQVGELAKHGYKVLACAQINSTQTTARLTEPKSNYQLVGLLAFEDPPRKEVYAAIKECQRNHIRVLMITGDHPATAKKIALDIGLGGGAPNVITAQKADSLLERSGSEFLQHVDVIARALPTQKFAIVKALRERGDIVAVTGDGVNDVPALRAADIGIAMGERGTQSAREAASIVLLDDNFGSIVNAIGEGKQLFKNLQLSFKYLLLVHMPYVISATLIPLLGYPLLYYPIHIVWIELFIHPTCMLVFQNLPNRHERRTVHDERNPLAFFSRYDWWGISLVGFYTSVLVILTYFLSLYWTGNEMVARANAFAAVGLTHIALTIGLSKLRSLTARVIVVASIVMLLILLQIQFIAHYFSMEPPSLLVWIALGLLSAVTVFITDKFA